MPTYDYVCDACEHAFEEFQSMTAKLLKKCPECGKLKLRRLIGTGAGVIFKGGGFYETDYRSDSYTKDAKADKPAETKNESKSSGTKSSDSKQTQSKSVDPKPKAETKKPAPKKDAGS
ncbi:MAG: zinc ribbon domain-containing protein [Planctomycetota bacterium]